MVDDIFVPVMISDRRTVIKLSAVFGAGTVYRIEEPWLRGQFYHATIWGWLYNGDPLELDDIQILIDKICEANGMDADGLNYDQHVVIPRWIRREIFTVADKKPAIENSCDWFINNKGAPY